LAPSTRRPIIDGVVCAFQARTDRSDVAELSARVAKHVTTSLDEVEALLLRQDRAVLGAVPRLLYNADKLTG
jgi:hypothetical protein